jgi:hypothetical protein
VRRRKNERKEVEQNQVIHNIKLHVKPGMFRVVDYSYQQRE